MTAEELRMELEKIVSNLSMSDFDKIDPGIITKLDGYASNSGELGMREGKHLIENLSGVMKAIGEGKSTAESGRLRLTALDFYVKKLSGSGAIEDL